MARQRNRESTPDNPAEEVKTRYFTLTKDANVDQRTSQHVWQTFELMHEKYSMEVRGFRPCISIAETVFSIVLEMADLLAVFKKLKLDVADRLQRQRLWWIDWFLAGKCKITDPRRILPLPVTLLCLWQKTAAWFSSSIFNFVKNFVHFTRTISSKTEIEQEQRFPLICS